MSMSRLYPAFLAIAKQAPKQLEESNMAKLAEYWKSILAFLGAVATNLATNYVNGGNVLPKTGGEWLTLILTVLATTWLVWQVPNAAQGRHEAAE